MHFSSIETGAKFRIGHIEIENFMAFSCDRKKFEVSKDIEVEIL